MRATTPSVPDTADSVGGQTREPPVTELTGPVTNVASDADGLLNLVLSATNDGLMDWDLVRGTAHYSERWKALFGFEGHELADAPGLWRELAHPDDVEQVDALLRDHVENLWPFEHRWRMRHKNGDWRWSLCRAATLRDSRGAALRCLAVFSDVTDQVAVEQGLAELTRHNDLLLRSASEGFLGIDESATITFANPAAASLLAQTIAALVGQPLSRVFGHGCGPEEGCHASTCPVLRPFLGQGVQRVPNGTCVRADGSSFGVDYSSTPAREGARIVGVVLTFRDVTEQRRLEAQGLQGQKLEAIGQLAAGIAHEINTPMQYIGDNLAFLDGAFVDLLKVIEAYRTASGPQSAAEEDADLPFLLGAIPKATAAGTDGVERVRRIVNAMKEFSHPGSHEKVATDLNRLVENTLTISANVWKHVASIERELDPDLQPVVCHPGDISQVVLNLVVNAAHAIADTGAGVGEVPLGVIRIRTSRGDGATELRIGDTGRGIPEAIRHRIFDPFFTTKEVGRGTGQGLFLARTIVVEKHGGQMAFVSEAGKGTTFVVSLPTATGAAAMAPSP